MLNALQFVKGAVASKDFVPALVHFHIQGGTIRGYNGQLALCHPIDLDLDVCPKATQFTKAIQTCQATIQLHMTPNGRLSVKSGKFKAFIDCIHENYPEVTPEGEVVELNGELIKVLKKLLPLIAEDASRQWARGILFRGGSAFATNNVIIAEHWLGYNFPVEINIPKSAVVELIRIGEEPTSLQVAENSITFHFGENKWLRTQTYTTQWPDLSRILDQPASPVEVPEGLWEAVHNLTPFVDDLGRLYLSEGVITTGTEENNGAVIEVPGLAASGCFNIEQMKKLESLVQKIDFTLAPKPSIFYGDKVRGAIVGMRTV